MKLLSLLVMPLLFSIISDSAHSAENKKNTVAQNHVAENHIDKKYFEIKEVYVDEVGAIEPEQLKLYNLFIADSSEACGTSEKKNISSKNTKTTKKADKKPSLPKVPIRIRTKSSLSQMIYLGRQIWKIIEAGKPVYNYQSHTANVLAPGAKCWTDMEAWKNPTGREYKVTYKNAYGKKVITFNYAIIYNYGGRFNGKGAYIGNLSIHPKKINVAWGYNLKANVEIGDVLNMGTKDDPIAGVEIFLNWRVKTVIKTETSREIFFVRGDGALARH